MRARPGLSLGEGQSTNRIASPFSQRVWIALEAKGLGYQYCETDPFRTPKPTHLLEANPRGLVPAIRQGDWACGESSVILEYVSLDELISNSTCSTKPLFSPQLEDIDRTVLLLPADPRLKANCRLWIDFVRMPSLSNERTELIPLLYHLPPFLDSC